MGQHQKSGDWSRGKKGTLLWVALIALVFVVLILFASPISIAHIPNIIQERGVWVLIVGVIALLFMAFLIVAYGGVTVAIIVYPLVRWIERRKAKRDAYRFLDNFDADFLRHHQFERLHSEAEIGELKSRLYDYRRNREAEHLLKDLDELDRSLAQIPNKDERGLFAYLSKLPTNDLSHLLYKYEYKHKSTDNEIIVKMIKEVFGARQRVIDDLEQRLREAQTNREKSRIIKELENLEP